MTKSGVAGDGGGGAKNQGKNNKTLNFIRMKLDVPDSNKAPQTIYVSVY